jgi:hypothetical protein
MNMLKRVTVRNSSVSKQFLVKGDGGSTMDQRIRTGGLAEIYCIYTRWQL